MLTIFCDEAGNSGENLLDADQPVYVLASNDFTTEEAVALLRHVQPPQSGEPKFKTLKKTNKGVDRLLAFLVDPLLVRDRIAVNVFHKRFMVVTKIVDLIFETLIHKAGGDLYVDGANIALSNMLHACMPAFCGDAATGAFLQAFVSLMRERTPRAAAAFSGPAAG